MDKRAILEMVNQDPQLSKAVDMIEAQVMNTPIMPQDLDEIIKMLEFVLENPDRYPEVRAAAVQDGILPEEQAPQEFNPTFVISVLAALYALQDRMSTKQTFARGGLATAARRIQEQGRGGDTMLAHINPKEAEVLRRMGGSGTINPNTGLHEYKGIGKILGSILPIAVGIFMPALAPALGTMFGASAAFAPALGSALIGAGSSALTGGNILQGAALGGLSGGIGGKIGGMIAPGSSAAMQSAIGSGLVGGAVGQATGQGFLKGATTGALGNYIGSQIGAAGGSGAFGEGVAAGGKNFGNMLAAGYDPKTAAISGGLSGVASGMMSGSKAPVSSETGLKPSDAVVNGLKMPASYSGMPEAGLSTTNLSGLPTYTGGDNYNVNYGLTNPSTPVVQGMTVQDGGSGLTAPSSVSAPVNSVTTPSGLSGLNMGNASNALLLAGGLGGLSSAPQQVQQAVSAMSPEQQEYFNRPSITWDWDKLQQDANSSGLNLNQYMSRNWDKMASGAYNTSTPRGYARGGALSAIANFAKGSGSGRDDTIDAKLSDGEYVMDAETVALLGDGSSKEGAKRLDTMRKSIREHKGKELSKGKFSPNAKSPLAYLKGAA